MNLLIVDDEPLIHVSIEYCLNELQIPDVNIHHAYSGSEMLKRMDDIAVDVALVDIRMPGMDGLEAIQQAKALWPDTFYCVMSGYSEFEYAREAVRLNVMDYLLKPLDTQTLKQILVKVKNEKQDRALLIRDRFRGWLEGTLHRHDVSSLFAQRYYAAVILFTYDSNQSEHRFWTPDFTESHHQYLLSIPCQEGMLLMIYARNAKSIYEILSRIPRKDLPDGITAFLTSVCYEPQKLAEQMHHLLDFSPYRVFYGIGQRYDAAVLPATAPCNALQASQWIALRDHLFEGRYTDYISQANRLRSIVDEENLPAQTLESLLDFVRVITGNRTYPMTAEELAPALSRIAETMLQQQRSPDRIDAVLAYVQEHYCENISISTLSSHFDLTPNYLSTLIKSRLGIKFTDYLTSLRITHAKELLLTTRLSVKEITEEVGYYSQSHFTKLFVEREGCTPAEFRNMK